MSLNITLVLEIALGIVLAVVILRFWSELVWVAIILGVVAIVVAVAYFGLSKPLGEAWSNLQKATSEELVAWASIMVVSVLVCFSWWWWKDKSAKRK